MTGPDTNDNQPNIDETGPSKRYIDNELVESIMKYLSVDYIMIASSDVITMGTVSWCDWEWMGVLFAE
jgi:hypothetical protein